MSRAKPAEDSPEKPDELRLRARLRALYHGSSVTAVRFRLAVLIIDLIIIAFFVAAPLLREGGVIFYIIDYVIAATLLGRPGAVTPEMVVADCDYVGEGYGLVDDAVIEALKLAARTDAIVLDPVYTGKAMKGLIALAKAGRFENETVVFLHTGGAQGLFGYQGEIEGSL